MPFPLAHPAAVLPLRRYCPQWLQFPALIIGSVIPDIGYASGPLMLAKISHRWFPGVFVFDLPVGLLAWLIFLLIGRLMAKRLPDPYGMLLASPANAPAGLWWKVPVSLLVGIWTHLFFDSVTHLDGLFVERSAFLRQSWPTPHSEWQIYEILYAACTVAGIVIVAFAYLHWLDKATAKRATPATKWLMALVFCAAMLPLAMATRGPGHFLPQTLAGGLGVVLMVMFIMVADLLFRRNGRIRPAAVGD